MNLKSYTFIINRCLVIRQNPVTRNVCIVLHFEPLGLRCEMTFMPLGA